MLTKQSINFCLPLTENIDARGIIVEPIAGTPLFNAVTSTNLFQNIGQGPSWSPLGGDKNYMSKLNERNDSYYVNVDEILNVVNYLPEGENTTLHDLAIENTSNFVASAIQNHLFKFRNLVIPVIKEFADKVNLYLEAGPKSPLLEMEIQTWTPPALLENAGFQNELANYKQAFMPSPIGGTSPILPDLNEEELIEAMRTGSSKLDKLIDNWVAEVGITELTGIFRSIFIELTSPVNLLRAYGNYQETKAINAAMLIFLITRKGFDNPVKGVVRDLNSYNSIMADYRNYTGEWLNHVIDEYDGFIKNGLLIRRINGKVTVVYQDVYNKWLEDGGENDILYGNMLERIPVFYVNQLKEVGANLKEKWRRHEQLVKVSLANRQYDFLISVLRRAFNEIVKDHQVTSAVPLEVSDKTYNDFDDIIRRASEADISNPYALIREIVCKTFFANTDANQFLVDMENAARVNPNIDPREASLIATLKYICRWVAGQVQFNKA